MSKEEQTEMNEEEEMYQACKDGDLDIVIEYFCNRTDLFTYDPRV